MGAGTAAGAGAQHAGKAGAIAAGVGSRARYSRGGRSLRSLTTHEEIGRIIGASRETVSCLLSDFKRRQTIQLGYVDPDVVQTQLNQLEQSFPLADDSAVGSLNLGYLFGLELWLRAFFTRDRAIAVAPSPVSTCTG